MHAKQHDINIEEVCKMIEYPILSTAILNLMKSYLGDMTELLLYEGRDTRTMLDWVEFNFL